MCMARADITEVRQPALLISDVGAISVGRFADIVGVTGDPLAAVTRLQSVAFVMQGGEVVKAPRTDRKPRDAAR